MALTTKERALIKEATDLIMRETINDGSRLVLRGFGTFNRKVSAARTAHNPQTGAAVDVPARSTLKFKASKTIVTGL